jgi:energy-converting hydrogenase Eha subunit E
MLYDTLTNIINYIVYVSLIFIYYDKSINLFSYIDNESIILTYYDELMI